MVLKNSRWHHGSHLGYKNRTILAILNLHVAPMSPNQFGLNPTNCSGAECGLKIFKMAAVLDIVMEWF